MHPAIRIEKLAKRYFVTQDSRATYGGYKTLRDSLTDLVTAPLRGLQGARRSTPEEFWALKNISFEVQPGEVVGIIGRNGAGKSTLLKLLSQITKPTIGRVELYGRVGSLLEVGTGFHPELTGRENIYLNGSILGMRRKEINSKFAEIVAFAEIEQFLDTPVKRYSSGMYVRLAFAVAAHLEPEILIIDEVLAVGDIEFQQRCLDRMRECASNGRTVLLVSHQMNNVRDLCQRIVWLDNGSVRQAGEASQVLEVYLAEAAVRVQPGRWVSLADVPRSGTGDARIIAARFYGRSPDLLPEPDGPLTVGVKIEARAASSEINSRPRVEVQIVDRYRNKLIVMNTIELSQPLVVERGVTELSFAVDSLHLATGAYAVNVCMGNIREIYDNVSDAFVLEVTSSQEGQGQSFAPSSIVTRSFCVNTAESDTRSSPEMQLIR